ncbi:MAG: hypothetical protein H6Q10_3232 [Acidobacteria bacterium]|nr:hypothetical protein [Acidobacteriota bacterium]
MPRGLLIAGGTGLIAVLLSVSGAVPAIAQGPLRPLMALIINDTANPVPVVVTNTPAPPPAPAAIVRCHGYLGEVVSTFPVIAWGGGTRPLRDFQCPAGVTRVDVQRLFLVSSGSTVHWQWMLYLSDSPGADGETIAVLTNGAPAFEFLQPVRLDFAGTGILGWRVNASTGIEPIGAEVAGTLYVEGVAVS